jgi:NitT/TauT family transport system substrate-binding protein
MEYNHLLEKHAAAQGIPNLQVEWTTHATGMVGVDALLSGNVDILSSGAIQAIMLWAKTKDTPIQEKMISGVSTFPTQMVTRDPNVHSIKDLTEKNRIGLSAVKVSYNAMLLEMAAAKTFGPENYAKLDPLTVTASAPDSLANVLSSTSEIDCDFSIPPYTQMELQHPGIHVILDSNDVVGAPPTFGVALTTSKFHDNNPKIYKAFYDAMGEAMDMIRASEEKTAEAYLALGQKFPADVLHAALSNPQTRFDRTPSGMMLYANFMKQTGLISEVPASWKDMFFPEVADLPGN